MKRTSVVLKALWLVILSFVFMLPVTLQAKTVTIATDKYWTVTDGNGTELGNAQNVCRNTGATEGCPQDATLFGSSLWAAIPGANWIWTPNTTGTSSAAVDKPLTFKTPFFLCGSPQSANISVAADNSAEVFINGFLILNTQKFSTISTVAIPVGNLAQGLNQIEVKVKNANNPPGCPDQYQCNPAGVVVKLTVSDNLDPWPQCKDEQTNARYEVGSFQDRVCPAGQIGANARVCICFLGNASWWNASNTCQTPPPSPVTCNGTMVNGTESVSCPVGMVGNALRTCQPDGRWSSADTTNCKLPAVASGEICGGRDKSPPLTATCPIGTECKSRRSTSGERTGWCAILGIGCPATTQSVDWYCDP